jgi:ubiquinone/menaquinone biosynthesis C-methylase UbiE
MVEGGRPDEIAEAYDRWAEVYDTDHNRTRDLAARVLRDAGLALGGRDTIEIGCGTGSNTRWLAERSRHVLALDISREMLRRAASRLRGAAVSFVQLDVGSPWPVASASRDVAIATLVLEHVQDVQPIVAETARVLRPGGDVFLCELHPARQQLGRQAEFAHPQTGVRVRLPAFAHETSEYVNAGLDVGLALVHMGEWRDGADAATAPARLLSLRFRRPGASASPLRS